MDYWTSVRLQRCIDHLLIVQSIYDNTGNAATLLVREFLSKNTKWLQMTLTELQYWKGYHWHCWYNVFLSKNAKWLQMTLYATILKGVLLVKDLKLLMQDGNVTPSK